MSFRVNPCIRWTILSSSAFVFISILAISNTDLHTTFSLTNCACRAHCAGSRASTRTKDDAVPRASFDEQRKHVYFLKTHKCASTTVQRIILRYALRRNLSLALPLGASNNFFPSNFRPDISKRTCSHPRFDVMAAHARYDSNAANFMPPDTFFISILRDPVEHMRSVYDYFLISRCHRFRSSQTDFNDYLAAITRRNVTQPIAQVSSACDFAQLRSLQLYEFGLELYPPPTKEDVERKIREIDKVFNLILIKERLDEGLILMRDKLKWTTADIQYLKSNFRVGAAGLVSNETRKQAYEWNWADKMLYDHFRAKMDAMIAERAGYIRVQLREFRNVQAAFYNHCVGGIRTEKAPLSAPAAVQKGRPLFSASYILSERGSLNYECQIAAMSEAAVFSHMNILQPSCNSQDDENSGTNKSPTIFRAIKLRLQATVGERRLTHSRRVP